MFLAENLHARPSTKTIHFFKYFVQHPIRNFIINNLHNKILSKTNHQVLPRRNSHRKKVKNTQNLHVFCRPEILWSTLESSTKSESVFLGSTSESFIVASLGTTRDSKIHWSSTRENRFCFNRGSFMLNLAILLSTDLGILFICLARAFVSTLLPLSFATFIADLIISSSIFNFQFCIFFCLTLVRKIRTQSTHR